MSVQMFGSDSEVLLRAADIKDEIVQTSEDIIPKKYDLEKCIKWINKRGLSKVCLQFPDHLLPDSVNIALYLKKALNNKDVYILGDTSYGSCCIDDIAAKHIDADGIIHFGHACLNPTTRLSTFHVLPKKEINLDKFYQQFNEYFQDTEKLLLMFYDVAYAYVIESMYGKLKSNYKNLVLSKLNCVSNIEFTDAESSNSVILGRSYMPENGFKIQDYEAIFIGPNSKSLSTLSMSIPAHIWHHYDTENTTIGEFSSLISPWLKRRRYLIERLKDAKVVAIVVATLGIADYLQAIRSIKRILKKVNKKSYIVSVGKINCAKLANFPEMDAFVVIACPESEVFDSRDFSKPVLMPYEVELAFNSNRPFSMQHCMDFRQILPGGSNYYELQVPSEPDVSLISGGIRNFTEDNLTSKMNALVCKSTNNTIAIGNAGASYLFERTWKGLEQRLGEDQVAPVEKGRSGLPVSYENEPTSDT